MRAAVNRIESCVTRCNPHALPAGQRHQVVGEFNFTTDILIGTFDYIWSAVYSQREYTATNTLILRRQ